jgi:hypothetical protein
MSSSAPIVPVALLGALTLFAPIDLTAQATHDQSRLVVGIAGGYVGGSDLWYVPGQPILTNTTATDLFRLTRRLRSNLTVVGQATWYPAANYGFTAEMAYIGLGTADSCTLQASTGDPLNRLACAAINGNNRPASAVSLGTGMVFRPASRAFFQPYVRGVAGIALAPRSTVGLIGTIGINADTAFTVYPRDEGSDAKLTGTVAVGIATHANPGYQFRVELRNSWVRLPTVTGPSAYQGLLPPTRGVWKALPSLVFAMDIVLEKQRGRRY